MNPPTIPTTIADLGRALWLLQALAGDDPTPQAEAARQLVTKYAPYLTEMRSCDN